jgi:uncharacterized membrane protein
MEKPTPQRWRWIAGLAAFILLLVWLIETPAGLLGKADAVGYAICHRIDVRSFYLEGRQLPLCARCTGMYLGILFGLIFNALYGRRGGLPGLKAMIVFGLFAAAFAFDGINSYLHLFPKAIGLYEPTNLLRLTTGTGMGLAISAFLAPVFTQTVWPTWDPRPVFTGFKELGICMGIGIAVDALVLSGNPLILYPLAILSSIGVLTTLTMIYTIIWLMITKRENRITHLTELLPFIVAGFALALLQISVMDIGRFWLTRTWAGFHF